MTQMSLYKLKVGRGTEHGRCVTKRLRFCFIFRDDRRQRGMQQLLVESFTSGNLDAIVWSVLLIIEKWRMGNAPWGTHAHSSPPDIPSLSVLTRCTPGTPSSSRAIPLHCDTGWHVRPWIERARRNPGWSSLCVSNAFHRTNLE